MNGSIECTGRVEIASSGRVTGEVTAGTLVIQEGAFFEGHLVWRPARSRSNPIRAGGIGRPTTTIAINRWDDDAVSPDSEEAQSHGR